MPSGSSDSVLLSPSKGKWIQNEVLQFQKSMMKDVALLLSQYGDTVLVEVCCSHDSMLSHVAQSSGMTAERWTTGYF